MKQCVVIFIILLIGANLFAEVNTSLALIYQEKIFILLDEQKTSEAEELLDKAMEYDQNLSGLWYARALIQNRRLNFEEALQSARMAYTIKQWEGTAINEFLYLYCQLLDRMKQNEEYISVYQSLQWNSAVDPELLLHYAESLRKTGAFEEASIAAEKGLSLFTEDPRFFKTLLSLNSQKYLYLFEDLWGNDPAAVTQIIEPLLWEKNDTGLWSFYITYGAGDWRKKFWENAFWNVDILADFLEDNEYIREMKYLESVYHMGDKEVQKLVLDFIAQSRERFIWDRDKDGYTDGYLVFQDQSWFFQFDSNQDGNPDGAVHFSTSFVPQHLSRNLGTSSVEINYHWPYVNEVEWKRSSRKLVYTLQRGSLISSIPPLYSSDFLSYCDVIEQVEWNMDEYDLLQRSQNVSEYFDQNYIFRKYYLHNGRIFMVREDSDLNGRPDRLLKTNNWQPLAAIRDLDEDGTFDLYEYFHEGQWEGVFLDNDNDQRGDFLESWNPVEILIWDFNQDGFMDSGFNKQRNRAIIINDEKEQISLQDTLFWDLDFNRFWFQ